MGMHEKRKFDFISSSPAVGAERLTFGDCRVNRFNIKTAIFIYSKGYFAVMKRRLIRQGVGGLTLYVPSQWANARNLEAGDEVDVDVVDADLIISSEDKPAVREKKIELDSSHEPAIRVTLNNLYRLGYDRIFVRCKNQVQEKIVRKVVEDFLLGFQVIPQDGALVLENITEPSGEKHEALFRRMFYIIEESFEEFAVQLRQKKRSFAKLHEHSVELNRCSNFCRRNISRRRYGFEGGHIVWSAVSFLVLIHYSLLRFSELLERRKLDFDAKQFLAIKREFSKVHAAFYARDVAALHASNEVLHGILYGQILPLLAKKQSGEAAYYCGELARLICVFTSPLIGITLR